MKGEKTVSLYIYSIVYNNLIRTHCIRRQNCLKNKYNNNNNNKKKKILIYTKKEHKVGAYTGLYYYYYKPF